MSRYHFVAILCLLSLWACSGQQDDSAHSPAKQSGAPPVKKVAPSHESNPKARVRCSLPNSDSSALDVTLEIADTPAKTARGLMYRQHLPPTHGMLFIFKSDRVQSFWMKNTLIPLDMLFLDSSFSVVGIVHEAEPKTTTPRSVSTPSRYVIEINGGMAKDKGLAKGSRCTFSHVPQLDMIK